MSAADATSAPVCRAMGATTASSCYLRSPRVSRLWTDRIAVILLQRVKMLKMRRMTTADSPGQQCVPASSSFWWSWSAARCWWSSFGSSCRTGKVTTATVSTATATRPWTTWRPPTTASAVTWEPRNWALWWQHRLKTTTRRQITIRTWPGHWGVWVVSADSTDRRRTALRVATPAWSITWSTRCGLRSCRCVKKSSVKSQRSNVRCWTSLTQKNSAERDKSGTY